MDNRTKRKGYGWRAKLFALVLAVFTLISALPAEALINGSGNWGGTYSAST